MSVVPYALIYVSITLFSRVGIEALFCFDGAYLCFLCL